MDRHVTAPGSVPCTDTYLCGPAWTVDPTPPGSPLVNHIHIILGIKAHNLIYRVFGVYIHGFSGFKTAIGYATDVLQWLTFNTYVFMSIYGHQRVFSLCECYINEERVAYAFTEVVHKAEMIPS